MIGLVDLVFQQAKKSLPPPNLEIMKLAEYYRSEENRYCRIINLDETELSAYEKIYIFSENDSCINIPDAFRRASNIIYGGSAFTNKIYIPFENELIDYTLPRPAIYGNLLKEKYLAGAKEKDIGHILDDSYYRRFAGKNELPIPPILKRKRVYIYDRNFFMEGWDQIIQEITDRKPSSVNFIHPIHIYKLSDFFAIRENSIISKTNDIFLDINIPLKDINYMMQHYKKKLLELIMPTSQVFLSLGGSYDYQIEYYKNFIYKLNLLYALWANRIPIRLKYEEPTLGHYDPLYELSKLVATWSGSPVRKSQTIYGRMPKNSKLENILAAKEQSRILVERFPQQKILFMQTTASLSKMGRWIK